MAGWQGEGRDTTSWDGIIKAKAFIGDGSGLTGITGSGNVATDAIWDTKGDLAVATGANAAIVLAKGTDGFLLNADSSTASGLAWVASGSGGGAVDSVFGRTGVVVAVASDYDHSQIASSGANTHAQIDTHIASGAIHTAWGLTGQGVISTTNLPDLSSSYAITSKGVTNGDSHDHSGGDGAQINHTTLSNIGTNTHATIDTHIADTSDPHGATLTQTKIDLTNATWSNWASGANLNLTGVVSLNSSSGSSGAIIVSQGSADPIWRLGSSAAIIGVLSSSGAVIASGAYVDVLVPFNCDLATATMLPDASGSLIVNVKKATYSNFPTFTDFKNYNITSTTKSQASTSGAITSGDILRIQASGAATSIVQATIALEAVKS